MVILTQNGPLLQESQGQGMGYLLLPPVAWECVVLAETGSFRVAERILDILPGPSMGHTWLLVGAQ